MGSVIYSNKSWCSREDKAVDEWDEGINYVFHLPPDPPLALFSGVLLVAPALLAGGEGLALPALGSRLDLGFVLGSPKIDTGRVVISRARWTSTSWTVEADQGQIVLRCGKEQWGKLTIRLRSGLSGDRNGQGVDGESADGEGGENRFEEHDYMGCREKEEITMAPGLKF